MTTTALHTSSSASVCVIGGSQHPHFFSLTTHESPQKAMPHNRPEPSTPVSTVNVFGQHSPPTSSALAFPSQPPMSWPGSSLPPLSIPPQPRPLIGDGFENESNLSLQPQRSSHSTSMQSPSTGVFTPTRLSHDPSPFIRSTGDERPPYSHLRTNSPVADPSAKAVGHPNLQAMEPSSEPQTRRDRTRRCHLYIRQQPRAARAGPDGKDRRAIDPPPILQLLINDFDPDSADDVAEIRCPFWVVHCRLVAAFAPDLDMSTQSHFTEDGRREVQRLLLGTTVASPTHTFDDPDPETMPTHPTTKEPIEAPASPTSRFLPVSIARPPEREPHQVPGAFFVFADVSVRKAGEYRLQFTLMKMEPSLLMQGSTVPAVDVVTSRIFRAVNAKDFDQVQPSTNLVRGLLERGAGFPLKLKKGTREGQRRKRQQSGDGSDDDDSGDYEGYYS